MKLNKIIFDMDGVITSEQNYWNTAALTIWQHMFGYDDRLYTRVNEIRKEVFCDDNTISLCKNIGINSNWDLSFVIYAMAQINKTRDFGCIYTALKDCGLSALELYDSLNRQGFARDGEIWRQMQDTFQHWYLGDRLYFKQYNRQHTAKGKIGIIQSEEPLFPADSLRQLLLALNQKGYKLGAATGRISIEIVEPLKRWGLYDYFDKSSFITFSHVEKAEKELGCILTKPHPYMFLKAMLGEEYPDEKIAASDYDDMLVTQGVAVGDAGADILAAKAAGMRFAAVLTGISGAGARTFFEESGADVILDNVLELGKWL